MPFIIWGSRGITSTVERGQFYCPECDQKDLDYTLKGVRTWFTVYFIPLFPVSGQTRYIECGDCRSTFQEEVLDFVPSPKSERLLGELYDDLEDGQSVEATVKKLERRGMDRVEAEDCVASLTRDKTWACTGCDRSYLNAVKSCPACTRSES